MYLFHLHNVISLYYATKGLKISFYDVLIPNAYNNLGLHFSSSFNSIYKFYLIQLSFTNFLNLLRVIHYNVEIKINNDIIFMFYKNSI